MLTNLTARRHSVRVFSLGCVTVCYSFVVSNVDADNSEGDDITYHRIQ
jgi:hypothetical protein